MMKDESRKIFSLLVVYRRFMTTPSKWAAIPA
jgi:hypothetical protein